MREIKKIVIHHSASVQGRGVDAATIHEWHMAAPNKWSGIGYHHVILESGEIQHGRPHYWMGAHAKGHNKASIGICLIGDFTKEQMTPMQNSSLRKLLLALLEMYPSATVHGHRDLMEEGYTECPGFEVADYLISIGLS